MKKLSLVLVTAIGLVFALTPAFSQTTMDPKTKEQVLRDIRYMIYDEIHILAHRYLNTDQAGAANSMKIGQQKIEELQGQIKSLCGGNDAPNSYYQQAASKAKSMESVEVSKMFFNDQQVEVKKIYKI